MNHPDLTVEQAIRIWAVEQAVYAREIGGSISETADAWAKFALTGVLPPELPHEQLTPESCLDDRSESQEVHSASQEPLSYEQKLQQSFFLGRSSSLTPVSGLDTETVAELPVGENPTGGEG